MEVNYNVSTTHKSYYSRVNIGKSKAWPLHKKYNKIPASEKLLELHKTQGTVAYLIIKNDSLLFEAYYDGYKEDSKSNSFSMAKSYVSGMLGKAIMEGYIKSIDQPANSSRTKSNPKSI